MKEIKLTRGFVALVDDEDFEKVSEFKWNANARKSINTVYAQRGDYSSGTNRTQFLHHFIMDIKDARKNGISIDHINHNALDNQKSNLRVCTCMQNSHNRQKNKNGTSKYKGVSWRKTDKKWASCIYFNKKRIFIGYFNKEIDAAIAYDNKAKELFGEFAFLNSMIYA